MIHLVLGDIAAGVLHEAMATGTPAPAPVLRFRDIYCLGPLDRLGTPEGAASRAAYWAGLMPDAPPAVAELEEEEARYTEARRAAESGTVLTWIGAHSSSQLWLQRLCAALSSGAHDLRVVDATEADADGPGRRAVSQYEPDEIGDLLARQRRLGADEIARLAQAWHVNAAVDSGIRRWHDGHISHHGDDFYDPLLLAQCDDEWQPAEQAIGSALWECDEFLGDTFFAWRLRCLAEAGKVEWIGPLDRPDDAVVRLPGVPPAAGGV